MDKQNEQVDFSNVTFSDFGKLSSVQKVGFLITLPIALPVVAVIKFFELFPVSSKDLTQTEVNTQDSESYLTGDCREEARGVGDTQWRLDSSLHDESVAFLRSVDH